MESTASHQLLTLYLIWFGTLCWVQSAAAQANNRWLHARLYESQVLIGYGNGRLPESNYRPFFLMAHLGVLLSGSKTRKHYFTLYAEPQINPVRTQGKEELEYGMNLGIQYKYRLTDWLTPYLLAGSGPHFITVQTERQASGFIFSDNLGAGCYLDISRHSAINIGYRFRHISNAGLQNPNWGINTHNFFVGFRKIIRRQPTNNPP